MSDTDQHTFDPRSRPVESWRGTKAVLASRGEVDGPRVAECDAALAFWRHRSFLIREGSTPEEADALLNLIRDQQRAEAEAVAP